jgi:two-component system, cell cycle sensor histidine kinase and response regulator CckA
MRPPVVFTTLRSMDVRTQGVHLTDWEKIRPILDEAPVVVFARDPRGRYIYVNRAFTAIAGLPVDRILGRTAADILPPEVAQDVIDSDRDAFDNRRAIMVEKVGVYGSRRRTYTDFKFPLLDATGRPIAIVGIGTDVTDRRSTERALQDAALAVSSGAGDRIFQELTRYLATILHCELALVGLLEGENIRTLGVYGLDAYRENFQYRLADTPCRDVVGKSFLVVPAGLQALYPQDKLLERFGAVGYAGYPLSDSDGRPVGVLAILSRKPLIKHRLIESVMKIFAVRAQAEIERRAHEKALAREVAESRRAEDALRASEEQYRAIFNATADALVLRDADFRIVDVNQAYERVSGISRAQAIGRDRVLANPAMDAQIRAVHARALAGESVTIETVRLGADGRRTEVELRGVPIQHRGRPHVLFIGRDISERRRAERERQALEAQLRQAQKMEALGHLTGGIAHDFNNLLASIMGYAVLASERIGEADPKVQGYLDEALLSCRRARDLIQQMLTFSRGQRGLPRMLLMGEAIEESLKLVRSSLPSTVEVRSQVRDADAGAMFDPVQLDQVLLNLCINARDAMQESGAVTIAVGRSQHAEGVCASCRQRFRGNFTELSVADTGPGIPPDVAERMFEPFYSTKEVGAGSGMGLATVHGIVHEHGGHLAVETAPGRGSVFRVLLPERRNDERSAGPAPARPGSARRSPLRGRVLVVDDEQSVAEFMRELLESWGLEAAACTSGRRALEHFSEDGASFDVVVTDQAMPGMTGIELARQLAGRAPGLPVVLYSGHIDRVTERESADAGIRAMLDKPVEPDRLYVVLKSFLH